MVIELGDSDSETSFEPTDQPILRLASLASLMPDKKTDETPDHAISITKVDKKTVANKSNPNAKPDISITKVTREGPKQVNRSFAGKSLLKQPNVKDTKPNLAPEASKSNIEGNCPSLQISNVHTLSPEQFDDDILILPDQEGSFGSNIRQPSPVRKCPPRANEDEVIKGIVRGLVNKVLEDERQIAQSTQSAVEEKAEVEPLDIDKVLFVELPSVSNNTTISSSSSSTQDQLIPEPVDDDDNLEDESFDMEVFEEQTDELHQVFV